jgi:uncharacterized protein YjbJ (UPF0337 family)
MEIAMSGITDKIIGEAKDTVGKLTGDKKLQAEGKADKAKGEVKDAVHDAAKTVADKT